MVSSFFFIYTNRANIDVDKLVLFILSYTSGFSKYLDFVAGSSYPSSDTITMMQIDCTVIDTRLVYVKEKDIPAHLKSQSLKNVQKINTSYAKPGLFISEFS